MDDPEWRPTSRLAKDQDHDHPLPVIIAISKDVVPTERATDPIASSKVTKVRAGLVYRCWLLFLCFAV